MKQATVMLIALALAIAGCEKETTTPQEPFSPCDNTVCLNGGICMNGACNCLPGWTGPDCGQEKTPVRMRLRKIQLTSFPPKDPSGAGWDVFDGPDVYLQLVKGNTVLYETGYVEDLASSAYEFTNLDWEIAAPTGTYILRVYDYDDGLSADDYMGGISFTPYRPGKKFPVTFDLSCSGCVVSFRVGSVLYFY